MEKIEVDKALNEHVKQWNQLIEQAETGVQKMDKAKYATGQKIPAFVAPFNKFEIANKQFTAKHSSILRILTKWTEYLEEIFQKPEKVVR